MNGEVAVRVWRAGAPTEDEYHNQIPGAPTGHLITGCLVAPGAGTEFVVDRSATTTVATVYAPAGADVLDDDEVEWPAADTANYATARVYEIDGPVEPWGDAGTVVRLKRGQG